ncbi:MAG: helix-turn-helix transcriptional regulator [Methanoregula sp.]|jgi:transcriptional regulator with XRE-family HTH domain
MAWKFEGSRIRILRESRGLNPTQLGKRIGATGQQVSQWESGEVLPGAEFIMKISDALEAIPGSFFVPDEARDESRKEVSP